MLFRTTCVYSNVDRNEVIEEERLHVNGYVCTLSTNTWESKRTISNSFQENEKWENKIALCPSNSGMHYALRTNMFLYSLTPIEHHHAGRNCHHAGTDARSAHHSAAWNSSDSSNTEGETSYCGTLL